MVLTGSCPRISTGSIEIKTGIANGSGTIAIVKIGIRPLPAAGPHRTASIPAVKAVTRGYGGRHMSRTGGGTMVSEFRRK